MSKHDDRGRPYEPILSNLLSDARKHLSDVVWGAIDAGKNLAEANNDTAERRLIYQRIGEFIAKQFRFPEELGFRIGVHLAGRGDAAVAAVPPPPPGPVATVAK